MSERFRLHSGMEGKIREINEKLEEISETGSDEKVMIFTDNPVLMELGAQINRLLTDRQKIKADFRREQLSSKKMLSNISHDIKTPLTVILGYLEIMRLEHADDEMLRKTEEKAKQLIGMINEFFTLAKLEAGDMDLELSRMDVCETCRESILDFYELLSQADFQVEITLPGQAVYVKGSREAFDRILSNLISNVIRYGAAGKYLGVSLRMDSQWVYVDVTDKGKGIGKPFSEHVFDRLFTMEDSRSRSVQGNGLGLTIAKNLALQMGGDLTLESIPHEKTVFTLRLKKMEF